MNKLVFDKATLPQLNHREQLQPSSKLPLLISVPHDGQAVPAILEKMLTVDSGDIFTDSDPFTRHIYGLHDYVMFYHTTEIARAVIDLNRSEDDLPPKNPDGVFKTHTLEGKAVYRRGCQPDRGLRNFLLEKYYYPYHTSIRDDTQNSALLCGLDCHSMLPHPPEEAPSRNNMRPFICLSNNGDDWGEGVDLTCSAEMINLLADCLRQVFPEESSNIMLNRPFKGGHISISHSKNLPWIQVELNRRAYLNKPWFNQDTLQVEIDRLCYLRDKFLSALTAFCDLTSTLQYPQNHRYWRQHSILHYPVAYNPVEQFSFPEIDEESHQMQVLHI